MRDLIIINSIDDYNRLMGFETRHPLVAVVDMTKAKQESARMERTMRYDVYSLWLKQTKCGDITYGRMPYDYQEGTVTSFAPGQMVHFKPAPDYKPNAIGLLSIPTSSTARRWERISGSITSSLIPRARLCICFIGGKR